MSRKRHSKFSFQEELSTGMNPAVPFSRESKGVAILIASLICIASSLSFAYIPHTSNLFGTIGYYIGKVCFSLFGLCTYPLAAFTIWIGWRMAFNKSLNHVKKRFLYVSLCVVSMGLILSLVEDNQPLLHRWLGETLLPQMWIKRLKFHLGGAPVYFLYHDLPGINLARMINTVGVSILALTMLGLGLLYLCKSNPRELVLAIATHFKECREWIKQKMQSAPEPETEVVAATAPYPPSLAPSRTRNSLLNRERMAEEEESAFEEPIVLPKRKPQRTLAATLPIPVELSINNSNDRPIKVPKPRDELEPETKESKEGEPDLHDLGFEFEKGKFRSYSLPSAELLTPARPIDQASLDEALRRQADILEETLLNFGIVAKVGNINCGPTITSFEVHPAIGVKVQRIKALESDIALNLEAKSLRIIAPIPGKAAVGIEVPNAKPQEVSFQEILLAYQQGTKRFPIPVLLGKAVNGDIVMSDLTKMPHVIIAGATGSGKSVCINTIVMSIVLNAKPDEVRLVMVDPKKVELTGYSQLPHMLAPVITEPGGACSALNWLVKEMESRYELLKLIGVRNIEAFNNRTRDLEKEVLIDRDVPEKLYYIVAIIDELADLMMVSSHDIETAIARIAQMARAVGIHLILATQRPSREVITGLIKANFPTRISFKVASRINSQIILDDVGAETLLGNGDMLFLPPGTSHLIRAQGAYIRDDDINRVVQKICEQAPPNYVIDSFDDYQFGDGLGMNDDDEGDQDPLYEQAKDVILSTGNASTTFLQRKLKIGYARAASIMDQLESRSIVGPAEGSKPRKILAKRLKGSDSGLDDDYEDLEL